MISNHQQLLGLLGRADPGFVAGDFATTFRDASEAEGETGSFRYFPGGFWEVTLDSGSRFLQAPWGGRYTHAGYLEEAPGRGTPPRRPPWSLVLPRYSTFLGREDDDWQIDASQPLLEEPGT